MNRVHLLRESDMGRRALIMISSMLIAASINLGLTLVAGVNPNTALRVLLFPLLAACMVVLLKWKGDRRDRAWYLLYSVALVCSSVSAYARPDITATLILSSVALVYAARFTFARTKEEKRQDSERAHKKRTRPAKAPAPPLLNEPETREAIVRARVVELESKIEPDQKELALLREEQYQLEQQKGYRGPQ